MFSKFTQWQKVSSSTGHSSDRSSRAVTSTRGAEYTNEGLKAFASESSSSGRATAVEVIVETIRQTDLFGPVVLFDDVNRFLGRGSQFVVYHQCMMVGKDNHISSREVAVKIPMFPLDPSTPLRLADPEVQKHLHDIYLEILALTNPTIKKHPNIVQLVGWSFDQTTYNAPAPVYLVMELAREDLRSFLQERDDDNRVPVSLKYRLCNDIAAGLDALHECGMIHGDLKPENVLIFDTVNGSHVAKLADFGLSIDEVRSKPAQVSLGGTFGWQAPELEEYQGVVREYLMQTDSYSFGLLLWSIMLHNGRTPPSAEEGCRRSLALSQVDEEIESLGQSLHWIVRNSLSCLLNEEPSKRPTQMMSLLIGRSDHEDDSSQEVDQMSFSSGSSSVTGFGDNFSDQAQDEVPLFDWEPRKIFTVFVPALLSRLRQNPEAIPLASLLSMFLVLTASPELSKTQQDTVLDVLLVASERGSESAKGVVTVALRHFGFHSQKVIQEEIPEWLKTATATGSILARQELKIADLVLLAACMESFRSQGGYSKYYSDIHPLENGLVEHLSPSGYPYLHWLATYGSFQQLLSYLESCDSYSIDEMTVDNKTALYLACCRGSWEVASVLLDYGADAAIQCTEFNVSCLHWLFAFDDDKQSTAVSRLIAAGAQLDVLATDPIPFLHYPFMLPPGTALHWAVAVRAYSSIEALVRRGADVLVRDGCDYYMFDRRIRFQLNFSDLDTGGHSLQNTVVHGFSALDYAAMNHEPFIFELLIREEISVDINSVDEEGLSVLHRLSTDSKRRTRDDIVFSDLVFRGSLPEQESNLRRTIAAIKALGGNMELHTRPTRNPEEEENDTRIPPCTPLMMAALGTSPVVVKALMEAGAYVDTENEEGTTALMCISDDEEAASESLRILSSYGADVNHSDRLGLTPVLRAAMSQMAETVDLFLCKGADINTRIPCSDEFPHTSGRSFFGFLARQNEPFQEENDETVAELLKKHVFACPDEAKRRQVIECGDVDGRTLLHEFSQYNMPRCVQALLSNGAHVNALQYRAVLGHDGGSRFKESWYETPLDLAVEVKERGLKRYHEESRFTVSENENLHQRIDTVISLLKQAGGATELTEVQRKPFVFDEKQYGKRGFHRSLRER